MTIMSKEPHGAHHAHGWEIKHEHGWTLTPPSRNVGGWERGARLFFGAAFLGAAAAAGGVWLRLLFVVLAFVGLVTSIGAYCPINRAAGRDSYRHHAWLR